MIYYFLALFLAAVIVMFNNPRNTMNHWIAFFLFFSSVGGLTDMLNERGYTTAASILQFLNLTCTPYCVLIFSIVYGGVSFKGSRIGRDSKLILFLPVLATAAVSYVSTNSKLVHILLLFWTAPYFLISCYLLIRSFWRERDARLRRNRFITSIIMVPTLLAVLLFIYFTKVFSPQFDFFNYISVFIIYSLAVAFFCTFIYGVLGVRVRIEHDPLESTMKAVSSGTTMLNHTIKNEIAKISISTENLRSVFPEDHEQSQQHMQIITNASNHMLAMVTRMHSQMKTITLKEEPVSLHVLIDQCIKQHEALLSSQNIIVRTAYMIHPIVVCDKIHISEAIGNVLMNACEAMPEGGIIDVQLLSHRKGIELSILDRGTGLPAEKRGQEFEPFYSSGKTGRNFGLGLSYVYNVMQKSGGSVELKPRDGGGARASLFWPKKKLVG